ncbi:chemotaxis protein CheW [Paenibacillus chartarius]|uniref:Chemotaxis protein CheW n=1 Tax=Paenibacillus chartarius TaxID=747481 RepID=A0ABV6DG27_9BACL
MVQMKEETNIRIPIVHIGVGQERYALRLEHVREVIRMRAVTELPGKASILGVVHVRGTIIPIVSLRSRLSMLEEAPTKSTRIVVIALGDTLVGLVVDRVYQVTELGELQPPPERMGAADSRFLTGIGQLDGELIGLLKLEYILEAG